MITHTNETKLTMKELNQDDIESYIEHDNPIDCAGSYKIEESGIALFEDIKTTDFTAIIGLPLIQLSLDLERLGVKPWIH